MSPVASPAAPPGISRSAPYDLVVVGGGINGCGIAADAAGRGLSVLLAEKGDLAGATSSASSKLIHGGLRYLEQYEFRLVREALQEREVLLRIAPHIVHPLRFVLPHGAGQRSSERPAWMIRAGLFLYDHLARRERVPGSSAIRLGEDTGGAALRADIAKGFSYWDCSVDDARLVVLNARMAARHGAEILTRRPVTALRRDGAVWRVTLGGPGGGRGGSAEVAARAVVNAAGPWAAEVGNLVAEGAAGASRLHLRLVRGSHVVVPRIPDGGNAFILQSPDGRVVFLLPFEERFTLIGTTDVAHADLSQVAATDEEGEYLLETANRYLRRPLAMDDIVWCFAGVRPLDDRDGESRPSAVTRDWRLVLDDVDATGRPAAPILHVIGGKITT